MKLILPTGLKSIPSAVVNENRFFALCCYYRTELFFNRTSFWDDVGKVLRIVRRSACHSYRNWVLKMDQGWEGREWQNKLKKIKISGKSLWEGEMLFGKYMLCERFQFPILVRSSILLSTVFPKIPKYYWVGVELNKQQ